MMVSKQYLVTGGCGFIGSHLVDALIAQGHRVRILDNLSTGKRENAHANAQLMVGDATDYATVEQAMQGTDGCFHLAAIASVQQSVVDWAITHTVNATATINVFQVASRQQHKVPVVYTSSAAVYGDTTVVPTAETAPIAPLSAYGIDKYSCDLHASIAWAVHGVPTTGLRPFNVYGPRQDPSSPYSGVISIFFERIKAGESITIFGDGEQSRDFVYVADVVAAFMKAMERLQERHVGHDVLNVCTGRATTVNQLASTIAELTGKALHVHYESPRRGDIRTSLGDAARLQAHLGLRCETELKQGLGAMLAAAITA